MTTEKSQRLIWLDCCKGFAIICVVIGHIADGYLKGISLTELIQKYKEIFVGETVYQRYGNHR